MEDGGFSVDRVRADLTQIEELNVLNNQDIGTFFLILNASNEFCIAKLINKELIPGLRTSKKLTPNTAKFTFENIVSGKQFILNKFYRGDIESNNDEGGEIFSVYTFFRIEDSLKANDVSFLVIKLTDLKRSSVTHNQNLAITNQKMDVRKLKEKYLKYKAKYLQLKKMINKQIGASDNILPGSIFQIMNLLVKLPFEVSIEINKNTDGIINLYLTKGFETHTDYLHESNTLCGIHIHTHPFYLYRTNNEKGLQPPTGTDIRHSILNIHKSKKFPNSKYVYVYDYVYDGNVLWYYKANQGLINEFLKLLDKNDFDTLEDLVNIATENGHNNGGDFLGLRERIGFPKITLEQYIEKTKDIVGNKSSVSIDNDFIGMDIGYIKNLNKPSIIIPDNLTCQIPERRDKHIIFPETGLLNKEELKLLWEKVLKILHEQDIVRNNNQIKIKGESPF